MMQKLLATSTLLALFTVGCENTDNEDIRVLPGASTDATLDPSDDHASVEDIIKPVEPAEPVEPEAPISTPNPTPTPNEGTDEIANPAVEEVPSGS